jgi:SAM-dependent methyltransferase
MRANYGIDAPGVIRNLLLVTVGGLLIWGTARAGLWSGFLGNQHIRIDLARTVFWPAVACALMAVWMVYHSMYGKVRERESLLGLLTWRGDEQVLDVGCGRGLFLIGAAKRLRGGTATGVDIWQAEDLSGNRPDATLENARLEGVADRVKVETADMRKLPFPDASFDTVVSSVAIHNLYAADDRAKAIAEIARVLKPGGQLLIEDIRHAGEYTRALTAAGCSVKRTDGRIVSLLLGIITFGSLQPATLVARKA